MATVTETRCNQVIAYLYRHCRPLMTSYQSDLEHDRAAVEKHQGTPFLHFTRETGTHIVILHPADAYPAPGEHVPYLFGTADRQHLLKEVPSLVDHFASEYNPAAKLILFFDGSIIYPVSLEQAQSIAAEYVERIRREWHR